MLPAISGILIVAGLVISAASPAAAKRKGAFAAMLTVGTILLIVGVIVCLLPGPAPVSVITPAHRVKVPRSSCFKKKKKVAGGTPSLLAEVGPRLRWIDEDGSNHLPLEHVLEFSPSQAPVQLQNNVLYEQPAHNPKTVPAIPMSQRFGYVSASAPGPDLAAMFNPVAPPPSVGGAVYYKPPQKYPTVGQIAEERNRFMSRPETPDIDRHRRLGQLREYALTMKAQRSGAMVPLFP